MKLSTSVLALSAMLSFALPVAAQQPAAPAATPAAPAASQPASGDAPAPVGAAYTADDAKAVLNARLAALKTVIQLTPEQEKLWAPVEASIRDIYKDARERRLKRDQAAPKDFLDVLDDVATGEAARAADLKKFVAATRPFVASLTDAQKLRIPAFLSMKDYGGRPQPSSEIWIFEEEE